LGLDIPERPLRDTLIKKVSELNFVPEWGRARFLGMLENRPDWCLSRQRIWGVPVPVLICKKTGEPIADVKIMRRIADVIESEGGIEAFYSRPAESFLGDWKPANSEIGSQGFLHSQDILDVWMDSGMCHTAVQKRRPELDFPADIYLEGSDQHRGWFNSSFLSSIACYDEAPYKSLVTHGFVQQSKGIKMSKSKGNAADPIRFCEQTGADILRLWVAHEDFGKDVIWGEDLIDRVKETYRRARNTLRYLLGNLEGSPRKAIEVNRLHPLDAWALHRHQEVIGKVKNAFDQYEFYRVYHLLNQYMTVELSALYFDVLKDRLYTGAKEGALRQSSITVLRLILDDLLVMLAPILSFLAEEAYQSDPQRQKKSVFLERFPIAHQKFLQPELATEFDALLALKEAVQKKLELKRAEKLIGSSLEAHVNFELSESWLESSIACRSQEFLTKSQRPNSDSEKEISKAALKEFLREFFIVSSVEIRWTREPVQNVDVFNIEVSKALGEKCPRCWVISPCLSSSTQFPGVCPKCVDHLSE
jgi:isoleucyl-tRNA synthetase